MKKILFLSMFSALMFGSVLHLGAEYQLLENIEKKSIRDIGLAFSIAKKFLSENLMDEYSKIKGKNEEARKGLYRKAVLELLEKVKLYGGDVDGITSFQGLVNQYFKLSIESPIPFSSEEALLENLKEMSEIANRYATMSDEFKKDSFEEDVVYDFLRMKVLISRAIESTTNNDVKAKLYKIYKLPYKHSVEETDKEIDIVILKEDSKKIKENLEEAINILEKK